MLPSVPASNPPLTEELFVARTERQEDGCLLWTGRTLPSGYAIYKTGGRTVYVYRWAYEHFVGPIPEGLTIEHLCHDPFICQLVQRCPHRRCAEPSHLLPLTGAENSMRGGSPLAWKSRQIDCVHGHPLSGPNLYVTPGGRRQCRQCRNDALERFYAKR